jgi:hypothetical protein
MLTIQDFKDNTNEPTFESFFEALGAGKVIKNVTENDLFTYIYGWCKHYHLDNNANDKWISLEVNPASNYEIFLLHPDDIPTFHIGASVSDKKLFPQSVYLGDESGINIVLANFYLTYYYDKTDVMNCAKDDNRKERKGKVPNFKSFMGIIWPIFLFIQSVCKSLIAKNMKEMLALPLGCGQ